MTTTPRTDAAREWYERGDNYQYALPVADTDMAKLERELAAMTAARDKAVEALRKTACTARMFSGDILPHEIDRIDRLIDELEAV